MVRYEQRGRLTGALWGLFLIALGSVFLLDELGIADSGPFWRWWPLVLVAIGIGHFFDRRPGEGVTLTLLGLWFYAVTFGWLGLTYRNSWSLALIAIGAGTVVKHLVGDKPHVQAPSGPVSGTVEVDHENR